MKYVTQAGVILLFSLAGEVCSRVLPFPVPAPICGMVLLLLAFATKILKVEQVKETGNFLVSLLPLLFVVPTVGLMACWDLIRGEVGKIAVLVVATTILTFGAAGLVTKLCQRKGGEHHGKSSGRD